MTGWLLTATAFAGTRDLPPRPASCPASPLVVVGAYAAEVEAAYVDNDVDRFDTAAEALVRIVGCIDTPISADDAIGIHHAMGLRAFAARDSAAAARSLRAIRLLDPSWRPSSGWMEPGQPLDALYREELPHREVAVPAQVPGTLRVDGRPTPLVPENEAFVLQLVDRRETAVYTGYHVSVATLPELGTTHRTRGTVRAVGTAVSVALLGGALASEIGAANARGALREPSTPTAELAGLYSRANTLQTVALGLEIGTATTAGLTWVIPW